MLPPLDSTSIGPETYITRMPPPPVMRMYRTAHFAEIDLPAASFYRDEIPGFTDRDVSAFGRKFGPAANSRRANMSAAGMQVRLALNISGVDVAAGGECAQIARHVFDLNVAALRLQFRRSWSAHGMPCAAIPGSRGRLFDNPAGDNVSAFGDQLAVPPTSDVRMSPAPV